MDEALNILQGIADKLDKLLSLVTIGKTVTPADSPYTLYSWLEEWFVAYKVKKLQPGSLREIRTCIDLHIKPHLQDVPLNKLDGVAIQKALNEIPTSRTRKYTYNVINAALKRAVTSGKLAANPMLAVDSVQHKYKVGKALTRTQQARFCEIIQESKQKPLYEFLLLSGCRRGEAVALKWSDIDNANKRIHVPGTKTDGSDRFIPLFPAMSELFASLPKKSETVFDTTANAVNCNFRRLKNRYNLPYKLHDLRHTFATRCLEDGIGMKTIQKWLGHSRLETTANIYTHITTEFELDEIAKYAILL